MQLKSRPERIFRVSFTAYTSRKKEINLALNESAYTAFLVADDLDGLDLGVVHKMLRQQTRELSLLDVCWKAEKNLSDAMQGDVEKRGLPANKDARIVGHPLFRRFEEPWLSRLGIRWLHFFLSFGDIGLWRK